MNCCLDQIVITVTQWCHHKIDSQYSFGSPCKPPCWATCGSLLGHLVCHVIKCMLLNSTGQFPCPLLQLTSLLIGWLVVELISFPWSVLALPRWPIGWFLLARLLLIFLSPILWSYWNSPLNQFVKPIINRSDHLEWSCLRVVIIFPLYCHRLVNCIIYIWGQDRLECDLIAQLTM